MSSSALAKPGCGSIVEGLARRSEAQPSNTYLPYIHSFRAIAIFFIVAGHCIPLFDWNHLHSHGRWLLSLLPNGTVFFVFISGFLFQHLSGKFDYADYLKKKSRNVLLPYLSFSIPIITAEAVTHTGTFNPAYAHHWQSTIGNIVWSLVTGSHILGPFWFIPMITIFYLLAPLFLWMDRDRRIYRVLPLLLTITILVHRPNDLDRIWHSCAYFLPIYIYGMWFSRYRERVIAWHRRALPLLLLLIAALTWVEVAYLKRPGAIGSVGMFSSEGGIIGTNAIQKLLCCGAFIAILQRLGDGVHRRLSYIGEISFAIFFAHMLFINGYALFERGRPGNLLLYVLSVMITLSACIACVSIAKIVLRSSSRSFLGA
jgi:probable poly-beta-1,6-N-acetyl-D-glucosamine export protein